MRRRIGFRRKIVFARSFTSAKQTFRPETAGKKTAGGCTIQRASLILQLLKLQGMVEAERAVTGVLPELIGTFVSLVASHPLANRERIFKRKAAVLGRTFRQSLHKFKGSFGSRFGEELLSIWNEMLLCKITDAFEFYLTSVLEACIRKNPKLIGEKSIKVGDLISSDTVADALAIAINKQVYEASFSGLVGIADYLKRHFSVKIGRDTWQYRQFLEAVEVRHLVVHHNSAITRRFVLATRSQLREGEKFPVSTKYLFKTIVAVHDLAEEIDGKLLLKGTI